MKPEYSREYKELLRWIKAFNNGWRPQLGRKRVRFTMDPLMKVRMIETNNFPDKPETEIDKFLGDPAVYMPNEQTAYDIEFFMGWRKLYTALLHPFKNSLRRNIDNCI